MSENSNQSFGPISARIQDIWKDIYDNYNKGHVTSYLEAVADTTIQKHSGQNYAGDDKGFLDFSTARNFHLANVKHFSDLIARRDHYIDRLKAVEERLVSVIQKTALFVAQTLCLSNGAVALATLAFMGNKGAEAVTHGMVQVLALSSAGFLISLLSGHVSVLLAAYPTRHLSAAANPWLPPADRDQEMKSFERTLRLQWVARALGYLSAVLLLGAVVVGACELLQWRTP